jgi:hypothetical protein
MIQESKKPLIITEGKTDWMHIKNALDYFKAEGEYGDLDVDFLEYKGDIDMGDTALEQLCLHYSKVPQPRRIICIFDCDNHKIIPNVSLKGEYKSWGNNVYSFCISKPSHRKSYEKISIEFYYTDDEIKTVDTNSGTRLFFSNEVTEVTQRDLSDNQKEKYYKVLPSPMVLKENIKKVIDEHCASIKDDDGKSIAHSKIVFADKIVSKTPGFDHFNLEPFKLIINEIDKITKL